MLLIVWLFLRWLRFIDPSPENRGSIEGFRSKDRSFGQIMARYLNPLRWFDGIFESMTFVWVAGYYYTLLGL